MKNVVIIGGGFGGVYAAQALLKKSKNICVTLISTHNYFLFTPMLHEIATGGISRPNIVYPIAKLLSKKGFRFIKGTVNNIDTKKKKVYGAEFEQSYDALIIATGSKITFFGIKGADKYSLPLRSLKDAFKIRDVVIERIEKAAITKDPKERKKLLTFILVGGGPTGVELAGELIEFIHTMLKVEYDKITKEEITITLVHRGRELLNRVDEFYGKKCHKRLEKKGVTVMCGAEVKEIGKDFLIYEEKETGKKKKLFASSLFWAAGFRPQTVPINKKEIKAYEIDETLQVKGHSDIYAVGDCASLVVDGKRAPMLAQVAVRQAPVVAHNILCKLNEINQKLKKYKPILDGFLVSVGEYYAVAGVFNKLGKFHFSGFFAWIVWRAIYLYKLIGFTNKLKVLFDWILHVFYSRDTSEFE